MFNKVNKTPVQSISLRKASVSFKQHVLFSDFSYDFHPGYLYILKGPSGCGKTTLLKILAGEKKLKAGLITFNEGRSVGKAKKQISFLPSESEIFMDLSVEDNLKAVCQDQEKINLVLSKTGLSGKEAEKGKSLSKGEAVRLALARILLTEKSVILLDEPTGNLDFDNAKIVFSLIKEISKERIVIISSHDHVLSEKDGDVILSYSNEKIIVAGNTHQKKEALQENLLSDSRPARIPTIIKLKLGKSLFKKTWKQNRVLFPLFLFLNRILVFCFSFLSTTGNQALYQERRNCGLSGIISEKFKPEADLTAYAAIGNFQGEAKQKLFIFNTSDSFQSPDWTISVTDNGIVLPETIANQYQYSIGSLIAIQIGNSVVKGVLQGIYSGPEIETKQLQSSNLLKELPIEELNRMNNPILISSKLTMDLSLDGFFGYCSASFFKKRDSLSVLPVALSNSDITTKKFWISKKDYDRFVFYFSLVDIALLVICLFFNFLCGRIVFRNDTDVLYSITGKKSTSGKLMYLEEIICFSVLVLISIVLSLCLIPAVSTFIMNFYEIKGPLFPLTYSPICVLFDLLCFVILLFLNYCFVLV